MSGEFHGFGYTVLLISRPAVGVCWSYLRNSSSSIVVKRLPGRFIGSQGEFRTHSTSRPTSPTARILLLCAWTVRVGVLQVTLFKP